jgi:molybdate/tungstate transport system substrate-binding protein
MHQGIIDFHDIYPGINVSEPYFNGSQALINLILGGAKPDIIASADFSLIDDQLISAGYTTWNLEYCKNSMVIAYRKNSTNSSDINVNNWFNALNENGYGIGDPNGDPCGYRSVMMLRMADDYYGNIYNEIFDSLITSRTKITSVKNGTGYDIFSPSNAIGNHNNLIIDDHAATSMDKVVNGTLPYAIVYMNLAAEAQANDSDILYMELPDELALTNPNYNYSNIKLNEDSDLSTNKTVTLSPIVYGISILNTSQEYANAQLFLQSLITTTVHEDPYMEPIFDRDDFYKAAASPMTIWDDIPSNLQSFTLPYSKVHSRFKNKAK